MSASDVHYPSGFGLNDVVAWGSSGLVVVDESSETIIKTPFDLNSEWCQKTISTEWRIYERLSEHGGHEGILAYHGTFESGIRLQYAPNYDLQSYIKKHDIHLRQRIIWARQVAEAIQFIHRAGVIHGDITCANIVLDRGLNAKLADFAGSSIDGSSLLVAVTSSHRYPGSSLDVKADLFALGSVLYHIFTGHAPFEELTSQEIDQRFSKGEFPDTASLHRVGVIIKRCWQGHYCASQAVINDLKGMFSFTTQPSTY